MIGFDFLTQLAFKKSLYYVATVVLAILLLAIQLPELKEKFYFKLETFFKQTLPNLVNLPVSQN